MDTNVELMHTHNWLHQWRLDRTVISTGNPINAAKPPLPLKYVGLPMKGVKNRSNLTSTTSLYLYSLITTALLWLYIAF